MIARHLAYLNGFSFTGRIRWMATPRYHPDRTDSKAFQVQPISHLIHRLNFILYLSKERFLCSPLASRQEVPIPRWYSIIGTTKLALQIISSLRTFAQNTLRSVVFWTSVAELRNLSELIVNELFSMFSSGIKFIRNDSLVSKVHVRPIASRTLLANWL